MSSPAFVDAAGQPTILSNMTTGIELEFLAYTPKNVKPKAHLLKALRAPVTLKCSKCAASHSWILPVTGKLDHQAFVTPFSLWTLVNDVSVEACRKTEKPYVPKDSEYYNMELKSRIINFAKLTPCPLGQTYPCTGEPFLWDANTEISAFVQRIHEAFSGPGYCIATNMLTGLHVHLGNYKDVMAVKSSLGMFGAFTALERLFDGVLPVSRIGMENVTGPLPGIDRTHVVHEYDDVHSDWVGSCSRVFLEMLRRDIKSAIEKDPESARSTIIDQLKSCNVPAWLTYISTFDKVKLFRDTWPLHASSGAWFPQRAIAVNLLNLETGYDTKNTVEIRAAPGSLDLCEIGAWYDLMGKLMLWLSNPDLSHRSVLESLWANPESSMIDLAKQVGALQSTIDFYADRLTADWAQRRFDRLTSNLDSNTFKSFVHAVESNRLQDYRSQAVHSKIFHKLVAGYYGQLPKSIFESLPVEVQAHPDSSIMNMDTCDYEAWADKVIANAATIFARVTQERTMPSWDMISYPHPNIGNLADLLQQRVNNGTAPVPNSDVSMSSLGSSWASPIDAAATAATAATAAAAIDITADDTHSDNASNASSEEFPFRDSDAQDRTFATPAPVEGFPDTRPESPGSGDDVDLVRPESPQSESGDDDDVDSFGL
ncbi:hypothetical protein E4T39_06649 [Aureobasidium subglaciale]|nr:hypothetical protein E4T39_06649 [Aureobasidium subglaciale]